MFGILLLNAQNLTVSGRVKSSEGRLLNRASVRTFDGKHIVQTNIKGQFSINLPVNNDYKKLIVTAVAFDTAYINLKSYGGENITVILNSQTNLGEVVVHGDGINASGNMRIDAATAKVLPSVSGNIEDLVKLNIGVTGSRNEMSSQYSVRGGNFDENLVYVNGIEIYRPQLIREGQQEGLSFINPAMVSKVRFSAGGFAAEYGDKSASVLDVTYKQARAFGMEASAGLLGASVSLQGISKDKKLTYISGLRYKNTQYMLNAFETNGDYKPSFLDFQSYISYRINPYWDMGFLLNTADNKFNFIPEDKSVYFGNITEVYGLFIDFEGQETDRFTNTTGALSLNFRPDEHKTFNISLSGIRAKETESFDIYGLYSLNQIQSDLSADNVGDSLLNLGYGLFREHARNTLYVDAFSVNHTAVLNFDTHKIKWGLSVKREILSDEIDEWEMLDSAGYSIPYSGETVNLYRNIKAENSLNVNRFYAYLQDRYLIKKDDYMFEIQGGIRFNYNTYNDEFLISPRASAALMFTDNPHNHKIRFASGLYYQPPFYKELKQADGSLIEGSTAQKSVHYVAGYDFEFKALGRHFKLINELYYKDLDNFIPFELDNVRLIYKANERAEGYVKGFDTKIAGDFVVNGAESSFTLSLMQTKERVYQIDNEIIEDTVGYLPRATDQLISANLFLQDYLPGNKNFKMHLNLIYGSSFPFWSPKYGKAASLQRSADYKRVDLGATWVITGEDARRTYEGKLSKLKSLWLTLEVFNLLDIDNTISYSWMLIVPNPAIYGSEIREYAAPNHLSGRRLNLKISMSL